MSLRELREQLDDDSTFQRYRRIRQAAQASLPYDSLCEEIKQIQTLRQARSFARNKYDPKELLAVSMDEVSHRARLTEIMVACHRQHADLENLISAVWGHIATNFQDCLTDFRTKGDKETAIGTCFVTGNKMLANLSSLITQCELVIKEIDQTSFHLTRTANLLELVIRREQLVSVDI